MWWGEVRPGHQRPALPSGQGSPCTYAAVWLQMDANDQMPHHPGGSEPLSFEAIYHPDHYLLSRLVQHESDPDSRPTPWAACARHPRARERVSRGCVWPLQLQGARASRRTGPLSVPWEGWAWPLALGCILRPPSIWRSCPAVDKDVHTRPCAAAVMDGGQIHPGEKRAHAELRGPLRPRPGFPSNPGQDANQENDCLSLGVCPRRQAGSVGALTSGQPRVPPPPRPP